MITQNSNNRPSGSTALTCDAGLPLSIVTPTNTYLHVAGSASGAIQTSLTTDAMTLASLGLYGQNYYLDAARPTTPAGFYYCCIQIIATAVLNVTAGNTTELDATGGNVDLAALSGLSIPAGTLLYGNFSKVVLISGHAKCMANPLY